jgi:hypothetical protein
MPSLPVNLIKGDKVSSKTDYRDALPVNMYAVAQEILGASGYMLCYPGLTKLTDGLGKDRAGNYNERFKKQFRVSGDSFIEVSPAGSMVLGTIPGVSQAALPYSFNTQAAIADGKMFLYDQVAGFREVTDENLGNPIDGIWVDGYYFLTDGEYIYHTDITDESSIDPLKFATAEFMPDPSLGLAKTQDNKVIVFGRYSIEYFVNAASPNFAFKRVETRAQKIGIVATHAKCEAGGSWYITGGRKEEPLGIHVVGVGSAQKVSTREIDKLLAQYTEPELVDMRMESYTEDGTTFILIHLPNETLYFNSTIAGVAGLSLAWGILKTDVPGDQSYRGLNGVFDANLGYWVYGDKFGSNIGKLDNTVSTQYDEIVESILYTPFLNLDTMSIDEIEIETIPGFTATQDAKVAFSATNNGISYGKEYWAEYGSPQDYGKRFIMRRIGYVRGYVGFKFRIASRSRTAFALMQVTYG